MNEVKNLLALDIGKQRIGIARANTIAKLPEPLKTLQNNKDFSYKLQEIIRELNINILIVGLPRGLDGNDTDQTKYVKEFISSLNLNLEVVYQDEALTSVKAEEYLRKVNKKYSKQDIDMTAAMFILDDYLKELS